MRRLSLLSLVMLLCISGGLLAQPWSSVLHPSRAIDWSQAGVKGGIPNRSTICATLNPGASSSQISSAISSCPSGQVVYLNAGTYNVSGITITKSNVTLRGAGPNRTILNFTGPASCNGLSASVCMSGANVADPDGPQYSTNWTAGYEKGTNVITVASTSGMSVGGLLILDQVNDSMGSDTGFIFVCQGGSCTDEGGGGGWARNNRGQQQVVRTTAISGNKVTIDPPILMPNWRSSQSPQAFYTSAAPVSGVGIEDLRINGDSGGATYGINFIWAKDCWAKNVMTTKSGRGHVTMFQALNITVRDSYFWAARTNTSQSYGIELQTSTAVLVENNIIHHNAGSVTSNAASPGAVVAYNYMFDSWFSGEFWQSHVLHEAGGDFMLHEGNDSIGIRADDIHGTHNLNTGFRNHWTGNDYLQSPPKSGSPVQLQATSRIFNIVGNVLGDNSKHTSYNSIYDLNVGQFNDTQTTNTLMRWGNYDTGTDSTRFVASEVPSNIAQFANPVPSSQSLPPSFYLPAKPTWWPANIPWPAVGPDVTGGNVTNVGGHVHKIPARVCYESTSKDGNGVLTSFNANSCYGAVTPPPAAPAPPTSLSATVQ